MTIVVGTDEAGYGPNLGPLVVAASAWRTSAAAAEAEATVARAVGAASEVVGGGTALWADSKQVFRGAGGLAALERAVCVGLAVGGGGVPRSWTALEEAVGPISPPDLGRGQWQRLGALTLPLEASAEECLAIADTVNAVLTRHGVSLGRVTCRGIYPREFNGLLSAGLNKSDILSATTLDLASLLRCRSPGEQAVVWCDRHGGRKRYGGLVARHFHAPLVSPLEEAQARSAYLVPGTPCGRVAATRIEFCVGGESRAPVALASLAAKYVREIAMHAFNEHWSVVAPGLAPTAGYPTDAVRWRRDAAAAITREGIAEDDLWRRA